MPKLSHNLPVELFREYPEAIPELLVTAFDIRLPTFTSVEACSGDLTQSAPVEYAADQVVLGWANPADQQPAHAVVFESQRRRDQDKLFSWPVYVSTLRARYRCGVTLVVFCTDEKTARWAAEPIEMGHPGRVFRPLVLGPRRMPVITDPVRAERYPAIGVLSALHHAADPGHGDDVFRAMLSGLDTLDEDRARFSIDGLFTVLDEPVTEHLVKLMETDVTMTTYHSKNARTYYDAGEAKGEANALLAVLRARGIQVPEQTRQELETCADIEQLQKWITQAATADTIDDVLA